VGVNIYKSGHLLFISPSTMAQIFFLLETVLYGIYYSSLNLS